jgi:hypothetical protein
MYNLVGGNNKHHSNVYLHEGNLAAHGLGRQFVQHVRIHTDNIRIAHALSDKLTNYRIKYSKL